MVEYTVTPNWALPFLINQTDILTKETYLRLILASGKENKRKVKEIKQGTKQNKIKPG
jgi:hypothetical protein